MVKEGCFDIGNEIKIKSYHYSSNNKRNEESNQKLNFKEKVTTTLEVLERMKQFKGELQLF